MRGAGFSDTLVSAHWVLLFGCACIIAASFARYYWAEAYWFQIEAPCDSSHERCYTRDCSNGECPPNGLSTYTVLRIPATTFDTCRHDSCPRVCHTSPSPCTEIRCGTNSDDTCTDTSDSTL